MVVGGNEYELSSELRQKTGLWIFDGENDQNRCQTAWATHGSVNVTRSQARSPR